MTRPAPVIIATKGLPGSGKSYWAKGHLAAHPGAYKRINNDDLRLTLDGEQFNKANETFIGIARRALINAALSNHHNIIVDNCNLSPKAVRELEGFAKNYGATLDWEDFTNVPIEQCIAADAQRPSPVGEEVIRDMARKFLDYRDPVDDSVYTHTDGLPSAVLCDLDGTLAIHNGRSPYDVAKCGEDLLNEPVAHAFRKLTPTFGARIIFSAREEKYRDLTAGWLHRHKVQYDHMFMRPTGDHRQDAIVKREMFDKHIRGRFNVEYVLDDRDRVVKMWRELGLTCFQVADGNF